MTPTKATDDSHDNGTYHHHAAGDPCPAERGDGYQAQPATGERLNHAVDAPAADRGAESLGRLDGHGLAALRGIILRVIDDGDAIRHGSQWELYESAFIADESFVNEQRLRLCDAIAAEIVRRAAPATAGRRLK